MMAVGILRGSNVEMFLSKERGQKDTPNVIFHSFRDVTLCDSVETDQGTQPSSPSPTHGKESFLSEIFQCFRHAVVEESKWRKEYLRRRMESLDSVDEIGSDKDRHSFLFVTNVFRIFLSQVKRFLLDEIRRVRRIHGKVTSDDFDGRVPIQINLKNPSAASPSGKCGE
jgi:hypothetical protein